MKTVARCHIVAMVVILGSAAPSRSAEPDPGPGAPDFHATPEHPFGFRGDGTGRFPGATPATEWSEKTKKNIRWSTVVGASFSSPILSEKFAFVTSEPNFLICLDRTNGKILWKNEIKPADLADEKSRKAASEYEPPKDGAGMAGATPVTDGKLVYTVLSNGIVCAVDLEGKTKWAACIDADQITGYGRSSSPILCAGKLIVHTTNLYAFDPATGKQLWMNADAPSTYGSPTAFKAGGVDVLVTPNGDVVRAADGKILSTEIGRGNHTSPVVHDNLVYFGENAVNAVRLNAAFKGEELWSATIAGDVFSSPLLHDNLLFTASGKGALFVFDTKGKGDQNPLFEPRLLFGESEAAAPVTYSSVTLAGKVLFLNSNRGDVVALEPARDAKVLAKNQMSAGTGSSPIFSGKDMFLRAGDKLLCIGE